jgi:hypothetical protein
MVTNHWCGHDDATGLAVTSSLFQDDYKGLARERPRLVTVDSDPLNDVSCNSAAAVGGYIGVRKATRRLVYSRSLR